MVKIKEAKVKYLTKKDLKNIWFTKYWFNENKNGQYERRILLMKNGEEWLLQQEGKCEPKKCKSACCKFIHLNEKTTYYQGFGTKGKYGGVVVKKTCSHLHNNKCDLWGSKKFPNTCAQFPHPEDTVWKEVFDVCTFKFRILEKYVKVINR